jgi:hypothetical protein
MKTKSLKICVLLTVALIVSAVAYVYVPVFASLPGEDGNRVVTERYVEMRFTQLADEIAVLRNQISGGVQVSQPQTTPSVSNIPISERDALFAEIMEYFEVMYGERLNLALQNVPAPGHEPREICEPQLIPFEVINPQEGQVILFSAGAEFILRAGRATAVTGPVNGIADVTVGQDVINGENIGLNHLMMIPVTDGRGIHFQTDSWLMVRGDYTFLN